MKKGKEYFNQIYEGNNTTCSIENIIVDIYYDFRICSICNDIISPWAEIKKIKPIDFFKCESNILLESNNKNYFVKKILEWTNCKKMELIYMDL